MPIIPIHHYAMENHPTIFEEESLTALELCARTTAKVNECIEHINKHDKHVGDQLQAQDEKLDKMLTEGIEEHVDNWLDEHPEATTTVQPGSLSPRHFTDYTRLTMENNYTTPQEYNAFGDGESDDTVAFQDALDSGKKVFIPAGEYVITNTLRVTNSVYGETGTKILFHPDVDPDCFKVAGSRTLLCENRNCTIDGKTMTVEGLNFDGIVQAGDHIFMDSGKLASAYSRDYDREQDMLEVEYASGSTVAFTTMPEWPDMKEVSLWKMNPLEDIEISNINIECMGMRSGSSGIFADCVNNLDIHNCNIRNFDYGQIDVQYGTNVRIHDNYCAVNYADELQYGILVSRVYNATIHGNTVNSERTAIDVSYGSQYVTVSGNSTKGNINTHWAINCLITGNTVNSGSVLLRGKKLSVMNNHITQLEGSTSAIDVGEGGNEGGLLIQGNNVRGVISIKAVTSGTRIIGNTFKATSCPVYLDDQTSVIHIGTGKDSRTPYDGVEISDNLIEYVGATMPLYGVDMYFGTDSTTRNIRIANNIIRNFQVGIHASMRSQDVGENMTITGNDIQNVGIGIQFRGMNNTVISNNTIVGVSGASYGISRYSSNVNTTGLVIHGNLICGFSVGIRIYQGSGIINDGVIENNCYVSCATRRDIPTSKIIPQGPEYPDQN